MRDKVGEIQEIWKVGWKRWSNLHI